MDLTTYYMHFHIRHAVYTQAKQQHVRPIREPMSSRGVGGPCRVAGHSPLSTLAQFGETKSRSPELDNDAVSPPAIVTGQRL